MADTRGVAGELRCSPTIAPALIRLVAWFSFPAVGNLDSERRKIDALRIVTALILITRVGWILDSSASFYEPAGGATGLNVPEVRAGVIRLALSMLLLIGLMTRLTIVALVFTTMSFDRTLLTSTLGSQVLMIVLVALLFCGAGDQLSFDRLVRRRRGSLKGPWIRSPLAKLVGVPDAEQRRVVLFAACVAYWVLSFGAILYHLQDDYWRSGDTVAVMLENSYLSRWYRPARFLEMHVPLVMRVISVFSGIGQSVFQVGLIVMLRWKWSRRFVIVWGAGFFVFSLAALQLSYLPHVEIVLWIMLFLRVDGVGMTARVRIPVVNMRPAARKVARLMAAPTRDAPPTAPTNRRFSSGASTLALVVCVVSVLSSSSVSDGLERMSGVNPRTVAPSLTRRIDVWVHRVGLTPPGVFNTTDLKMGDAWVVVSRISVDGDREIVPFSAADGHRLWYHHSDVVYGSSIRWRRLMIDSDIPAMHEVGEPGYLLIQQIVEYDYRRHDRSSAAVYQIEIFRSAASDIDVEASERFEARLVHQYDVVVGG